MKDKEKEPTAIEVIPGETGSHPTGSKKEKLAKSMKKIGVLSLFVLAGLIVGAAVIFFAVVLPLNKQIAGLNENINTINTSLAANQAASLQKGEALAACTTNLAARQSELDLAKKVSYSASLMYEASSAQQALLSNDPASAGTRLSLAQDYLSRLTPLIKDQTDLQGLETPLKDAVSLYKTDAPKAVSRLDALIKTLHQLIETMQGGQ